MSITLREVENQEKGGIYVLNKTRDIERGRVVFQVPKANGVGSDAVIIPPTFIPLDLTEQVSRKQLLESSEFRKAVNSRRVELISESEYESLMKDPMAGPERDRLYNQSQIHMNSVQALDRIMDRDNTVIDPALSGVAPSNKEEANIPEGGRGENSEKVSPAVLHIITALEEDKDEVAAISTLRNLGELEESDYAYVLKYAPKEFQQIRVFCNRNLQRIKGANAN